MGFLISDGYVRQARDVLLIHHCGMGLSPPEKPEKEESLESRDRVEVTVVEGDFRQTNPLPREGKFEITPQQAAGNFQVKNIFCHVF